MIIQVTIEQDDYKKLKQKADSSRLSISATARMLIALGLEERKV